MLSNADHSLYDRKCVSSQTAIECANSVTHAGDHFENGIFIKKVMIVQI